MKANYFLRALLSSKKDHSNQCFHILALNRGKDMWSNVQLFYILMEN